MGTCKKSTCAATSFFQLTVLALTLYLGASSCSQPRDAITYNKAYNEAALEYAHIFDEKCTILALSGGDENAIACDKIFKILKKSGLNAKDDTANDAAFCLIIYGQRKEAVLDALDGLKDFPSLNGHLGLADNY